MRLRSIDARIAHTIRTVYCFQRQLWLLAWEVWVVFFFMYVLKDRRLPQEHPWATGRTPDDDGDIWPRNIVYRSPSRLAETSEESDAKIVRSVGKFLCAMVRRSNQGPEIPHGPKRRMPHAVNYIHGAVHYNGAFLVFDDFADLVSHLTDRQFRRDLLRFGRRERREVTLVFRNRDYEPLDFAYMVGCVRAHLPSFSNGNGPTKRPVLWGNMSPYPAIALINGAWMSDLFRMWRGRDDALARAPIDSRAHFRQSYCGSRSWFTFTDRLLAWYMYTDVRSRGFRGQLFFTNRKRIEPQRVEEYEEAGGYWKWAACHEVPPPWSRAHSSDGVTGAERVRPKVSVVIPALDEQDNIAGCVRSVRRSLRPDEIIVVDGGSSDKTVARAQLQGAKVVQSEMSGRGNQCRAGADEATGDILVFLHADCRLEPDRRDALVDVFCRQGRRIAMFRQTSSVQRKRYRLLDWASRWDTIFTRFGDQGIAVRRDFYETLGGMPAMRLFEDVEFLRRARRRERVRRLPIEIEVSPRRFEENGFVRQLSKDALLLTRYYLGEPPNDLYARYHGADERAGEPC